jgi:hypothetical protein
MSLIHWFSRLIFAVRRAMPAKVQVTRNHKKSGRSRLRVSAMVWVLSCSLLAPAYGWSAGDDSKGTIVAAGFGYQIGDASTITVKVYDAASGDVLSDDVYELNVNEGKNPQSTPSQERIFAGGVGLGATDLSNFVLRVYDAKTGKFQWEGQLNLTHRDGSGAGQVVSTLVLQRATVTKIHATETASRQPSFLLRALDPLTGGLVWEDEFSTDGAGSARVERIAMRLIGLDGNATGASHTFDFRIRMFDRSGRAVLWEDQISQQEAEVDTHEAVDDQAHELPSWPRQFQQGAAPEAI